MPRRRWDSSTPDLPDEDGAGLVGSGEGGDEPDRDVGVVGGDDGGVGKYSVHSR